MSKELYYDSIADEFESWMNDFDVSTRLAWFRAQLGRLDHTDGLVLDVGSGLGHFSALVSQAGGHPVSLDIAAGLLRRTPGDRRVRASALQLPFADRSLPGVVSSECIEHTPDPIGAVREMLRVTRPGGFVVISCPNRAWRWSVTIASVLGLRKFRGIENWPRRGDVRRALVEAGAEVVVDEGLYLLPFQLRPLRPLIAWLNRHGQRLRGLMINQCWVARLP